MTFRSPPKPGRAGKRISPFTGRRRAWDFGPACGLLSFLLLLCLLLTVQWMPSLLVTSDGEVLFDRVLGFEEFEVVFRHSYNKGMIREIYRISPDRTQIALLKSYNQSFGAGMADTVEDVQGRNFRQEEEWFVMDFPTVVWVPEVRYIGGAIAGHRLIYEKSNFEFGNLYTGRSLTIQARRRSPLQKFLRLSL